MANYRRDLGRGGYGTYGEGQRLDPETLPKLEWDTYNSFKGGYNSSDSRQNTPAGFSPYSCDVEVTANDRLRRAPGVLVAEALPGHSPVQMVMHTSLGYVPELLLFDPPYMGIRGASGATTWYNVGLPAAPRGFAHTHFGEELIFSSGAGSVYRRLPGGTALTALPQAPPAETYATFGSRVFAGNVLSGGTQEPLGIMWSAANSDSGDWSGSGSSYELLVSNTGAHEKIVAMLPLSFDIMAIMCRHSVWVGLRTGQLERPADFQARKAAGAIHDRACALVGQAVAYLSDDGVRLFDGNVSSIISQEINADLLPLDQAALESYVVYYHEKTQKLYVLTPDGTWIRDMFYQRWERRSLVAKDASVYPTSVTIGGVPRTTDFYNLFFLLDNQAAARVLGLESHDASDNAGVAMTPLWEFPLKQGRYGTQLVTHSQAMLNYSGAGSIKLYHPDTEGDYVETRRVELPTATNRWLTTGLGATGTGLGSRLEILAGDVEVIELQTGFVVRGPRRERRVPAWPTEVAPGVYEHTTSDTRDAEWMYDSATGHYVLTPSELVPPDAVVARLALVGNTVQEY